MSDTKISALTADASPTTDDLVVTVNDPGGTPANRKVTLANVATLVLAQTTFTDHSARHESGGADAIKLDDLAAPDDNTDLDASTTKHGLLPKAPNTATTFLNGQVAYATPDHGSVGGLTDDDHTQYALLAGRSGGQTLIGGTASGDDLVLQSTANATRGQVFLENLGSVSAPALAFSGATQVGVYSVSGSLRAAIGGFDKVLIHPSAGLLNLGSGSTTFADPVGGSAANSYQLANSAASSTVPTVRPSNGDTDTGVGLAGANQLALIAGGVNGLTVAATVITPAGRVLGVQGADVASANDITLGNGNYFDITGTTQINTVASTGWTAGSLVTLQFDGSVTVAHNTAGAGAVFLLAGAANFSATAGDTLTIRFDGVAWRECARTVI